MSREATFPVGREDHSPSRSRFRAEVKSAHDDEEPGDVCC